jgi:SAM-dependent MidA family methyltransferase
MGAGIEQELQAMAADLDPSNPEYLSLARGARTLLLPGEMGESVKFMMLTKNIDESELSGEPSFALRDMRDSL